MRQISVIVPTLEEGQNLPELLERLRQLFSKENLDAEVLVVDDDSQDESVRIVQEFSSKLQVSIFIRKNERGLATAVLEGFRRTQSPFLVVCDADLSHPVEKIADLLRPVMAGEVEMAIGSRYVAGGRIVGRNIVRNFISRLSCLMARPLTPVRDPMSGFFALRREILQRSPLRPVGYKIGLEILVRCRASFLEIPITFQERLRGSSKLGFRASIGYLRHLGRLMFRK